MWKDNRIVQNNGKTKLYAQNIEELFCKSWSIEQPSPTNVFNVQAKKIEECKKKK